MRDLRGFDLTDEHERTLRALTIDEHGPGTILHDFEALLAYVRGRELPVSKVTELPSLTVLPQMNALLSKPTEVRLKRPRLKSYPHLEGLYLLLRATGLGQIGGTPTKLVLAIDPSLHAAWSALNPVEQYFTLLETWMLRGDPAIVGGRSDPPNVRVHRFIDAAEMLRRAGGDGLAMSSYEGASWFWHNSPGPMGFALLELFGLARVVSKRPREGRGWAIERICRTPLGMAVLALLNEKVFSDTEVLKNLVETPQPSLGALQPIFAPYVPQWQHTLALPSWDFRPGRYTFKVSLGPDLWRRIAVDARASLDALAGAILQAYDLDDDDLYEFWYRNRYGIPESVAPPFVTKGSCTSEMRVGEVPLRVQDAMIYAYGFRDEWEFVVVLEKIEPAGAGPEQPALLEARGRRCLAERDPPEQYPDWDVW